MTVSEDPVTVSLDALQTGIDNETLTKAFGPNSLGIIIVRDLPPEFKRLRQKVLTSASILANLENEELEKLECEEAMWLVGWSRGREKLANSSVPDFKKGSFYMNCAFHKDPKLEGPEPELVEKYPNYKPYTASNIWPTNALLQDFEHDCKALCSLIIEVAGSVAKACDKYISSIEDNYHKEYLQVIVKNSTCTKARLLHYFPTTEKEAIESVDDWCGEHLDHSCITGLTSALFIDESKGSTHTLDASPDSKAGLYIKNRNDEVVKVSIPADCLAFQSGSALQEISKGKFKAVPHYVKGTDKPNIARNTLAVFCQPDLDEMVNDVEDFAKYSDRILRGNH
ncbi:2OG-Fe(II) oxygenase family protein [Candida parapsilosis]|uniref:Isopenicillin N synthase-like Fe(2+) 2OG dioxygenase domain-containing protein n=2 Tax=Candida parapsilosis TaxID=5480 RepID=G8BF03_CANPC|nr:uncharacterized protein CPAR2_201040 [Candida parapsilosis]KAF6055386.1 2OG-Fe(II) oxygenase family protein [Candida parapsilosis]KAF6055591.1 2OG-Fe(II) oxygenase family protein [Candida parapsilosis]KAF6058521.1 2OG-Fe(II) oxygenase family protein [Candida parapsilosis]KAF6067278.1 2OG-Fe(II) oxygenase family protein [Candida parapsilosis]KAI5905679.1 hypothetical protein K4G60_g4939 [Candida parapsilosis]